MMTATQVLREEHRLIVRATDCLDRLVDYALDTDQLCIISALELLEFFEHFVDVAHQDKEERHLFPALIHSGLAAHRIRTLLEEHERERETLTGLRNDLEGAAFGSAPIVDRFLTTAARYATIQRLHVEEEEEGLLPLVEEYLDDTAQASVVRGFAELDDQLLPQPATHYAGLVESVEARLDSAVTDGG